MPQFLHVSLRSRGRDRSSEWYCRNLGFVEERRSTTGIGTLVAILRLPGNTTYIEVSDRAAKGHDFELPDNLIHLAFTTTDMRETHARLTANGATCTAGGPDSRTIWAKDADGYDIEIMVGERPNVFDHLRLRVADLDQSVTFYSQVLGFRPVRELTSPQGRSVFVELPGNTTRLQLTQVPGLPPPQVPEDLMHMAFPVPDMAEFRRQMASRGVRFEADGRLTWVYDPDGYELEMVERRPAAP